MLRRSLLVTMTMTFALLTAGCGGDDSAEDETTDNASQVEGSTDANSSDEDADDDAGDEQSTSTTATGDASTSSTPSTTAQPADTDTGDEQPEEIERTDWLTVASGLTMISFEGGSRSTSASTGVRAIDGEPTQIGFGAAGDDPATYVFELPAETTFDRFAVPDVRNSPGNTTFFASIEIAGSNTSATDGYEVLVAEEFSELPEDQEEAEFTPVSTIPVRWIRMTLSGGLQVEPEHGADRTVARFTELIGNGVQATVPLGEGFDGLWELTFLDNPDGAGQLTELHQEGARVAGCIGFAEVTGTVTGNVARLNGIDTRDQRPSAYLLVVDDDGLLRGMESTNNGVFRARISRLAPDGTTTECSRTSPEPLACGSIAYINFDLDSAVIRPDSAQVLDDLFDGLSGIDGRSVLIEGHTSTEGSTEHNQDLSERRAQAVVDALVAKGYPADQITAVGKGETEPLVSESDETSRALNRRVEIECA